MVALATLSRTIVLAAGLWTVEGSGVIKEESRPIGEFHGVRVSAGIHAIATLGEAGSVKVEADENLLPLVELEVVDGILEARTRQSVRPTKPIKVTIVATKLDSLQASGGARLLAMASPTPRLLADASGGATLVIEGLAAGEVAAESTGGAKIDLAGNAKTLVAHASGGAKVAARKAQVETAQVEASGGARVEVAASAEIRGHVSGGATLAYEGKSAKVAVTRSGGGRVMRLRQ